jgi:hypothetical protein
MHHVDRRNIPQSIRALRPRRHLYFWFRHFHEGALNAALAVARI